MSRTPTLKQQGPRSHPASQQVEPVARPLNWKCDGTLVDYGSSFIRERDIGPLETAHKHRISALRWACGSI